MLVRRAEAPKHIKKKGLVGDLPTARRLSASDLRREQKAVMVMVPCRRLQNSASRYTALVILLSWKRFSSFCQTAYAVSRGAMTMLRISVLIVV